jgi:hypothetical protein
MGLPGTYKLGAWYDSGHFSSAINSSTQMDCRWPIPRVPAFHAAAQRDSPCMPSSIR